MVTTQTTRTAAVGDRVVVTGAAGFIASHLVDALPARGHEVVAADRRSTHDDVLAAANLARAVEHPRLRLCTVELATEDLDELVAGADTVFHLAAVAGVRSSWGTRFGDCVTSNVVATHRLLTACENAAVRRLVLASSASVYGTSNGPSREDDPTGPISPYRVTKLAAEHLCRAHAGRPDTELTVVVPRYSNVYGPRQRPGMAIGRVLLGALVDTGVPLYGDGRRRREFTYVDDVVAATLAAASAQVTAAVVNVGSGHSTTVLDILDLAHEVTGWPVPVLTADPQAGEVTTGEADPTLARRVLGYRPTVDLREGMARHMHWLAELNDPLRMFTPPGEPAVSR